jgi:hypothetical protein
MQRTFAPTFLAVAVALALAGLLYAPASAQSDDGMVEWLDDYGEALAEARRTGKPIFLEFRCAP